MFCRNCGNKIVDGSKFCSECGTKVIVDESSAAPAAPSVSMPEVNTAGVEAKAPEADTAPLFEPFDFKAFGFDFSELGLGTGVKTEEAGTKPTPPTETFDWNTGEFPDRNTATKTEDIDFNWSLSAEENAAPAAPAPEAPAVEVPAAPAPEAPAPEAPAPEAVQDSGLFGSLDSKADETRKQSEEIDKFFTFHQKNEEFQKILDREYEKVKSGNIIAEEISAAEAGAAEKFTERKPEDPMEDLFASEGVIKTYEPKPIETDVLDRIEAADEEKRVKEEAARLIEEEKARMEAETAKAEEAPVETGDFDLFAELEAMEPADEAPAEPVAEEPAAEEPVPVAISFDEAPAAEAAPVVEEAPAAEAAQEAPVVNEVPAAEVPETPAAEEPVISFDAEPSVQEPVAEAPAVELTEEELPEKTKTVDKAAILAGMAIANEMVERDRAIAAEQAAEVAAVTQPAHVEPTNIELPDFLGHEEVLAEAEEAPVNEDVEFELFEQLENAESAPEEEIVLTDSQTLVDLFADAETVENHEKGWTEHTLILSEDSVAEILNASGEEEVTENTVLFSAETLGAILAEAEQENPEGSEVVVSVESLTDVPAIAADLETESLEEEEEIHGGKGRVVLKVLLVILIILLALEIAGVVIKLAAPTSGAANFIDNQLTKVFQLISGEDDKELSVFAEAEEIRTEPMVDKTELIAAEKSKNKNGNIGSIVYNQDLAFDSGKKYENTDLSLTQSLTDVAWYKNADNKQVYYDQAIVGAMIAFESQRVNLVNSNDTNVLNLMIEGTALYNEVAGTAGKGGMTMEMLQLGEIRQSGSSYFIWTAETVNGKTAYYVYELQPQGETMKLKARHKA